MPGISSFMNSIRLGMSWSENSETPVRLTPGCA